MNDKKIYVIIVVACFIVGCTIGWFVCGRVYDNKRRVDTINEQFGRVGEYQQTTNKSLKSIRDGLDSSIDTSIRAEERTNTIKEAVGNITDRNQSSIDLTQQGTERIRDSKSILQAIRERAKTN